MSQSSSIPARTLESDTGIRATMLSLRSGPSVADANESIAETSRGSSMPPIPARSIASRRRSGPFGRGGRAHVKVSGKW